MDTGTPSPNFITQWHLTLGLILAILLVTVVALFAVCEYVTDILPFCTEEKHPLLAVFAIAGMIFIIIATTARLISMSGRSNS